MSIQNYDQAAVKQEMRMQMLRLEAKLIDQKAGNTERSRRFCQQVYYILRFAQKKTLL